MVDTTGYDKMRRGEVYPNPDFHLIEMQADARKKLDRLNAVANSDMFNRTVFAGEVQQFLERGPDRQRAPAGEYLALIFGGRVAVEGFNRFAADFGVFRELIEAVILKDALHRSPCGMEPRETLACP